MVRAALLAVFLLASSQAFAQEGGLKPELRAGTWTNIGPKTVIGSGTDTEITLAENEGEWTIAYRTKTWPRVNEDRQPVITAEGPFPVTAADGVLRIQRPDRLEEHTFLVDAERLVMPAILSTKPGEWRYRSNRRTLLVQCANDPRELPTGKVCVDRLSPERSFYVYESAPDDWHRVGHRSYLRFLEQNEAGVLVERSRLIFYEDGLPRFQRRYSNGDSANHEYPIRGYFADPRRGF